MGRVDKKLKKRRASLTKKDRTVFEAPHYYLLKMRKGDTVPAGWIYNSYFRDTYTEATVKQVIDQLKAGARKIVLTQSICYNPSWYLYPGPRPDPRWGVVSP